MSAQLTIGISDMKIVKSPGSLITYALGSCIGICLYDPTNKMAGMVHIMLPKAPQGQVDKPLKYADSGLKELINKMVAMGGNRRAFVAKIAGGAKMFDIPGDGQLGNIGNRNIEAAKEALRVEGIRLLREEVGFNFARTLTMEAETGICKIKAFGMPDRLI